MSKIEVLERAMRMGAHGVSSDDSGLCLVLALPMSEPTATYAPTAKDWGVFCIAGWVQHPEGNRGTWSGTEAEAIEKAKQCETIAGPWGYTAKRLP
jgi:hypothetical protein